MKNFPTNGSTLKKPLRKIIVAFIAMFALFFAPPAESKTQINEVIACGELLYVFVVTDIEGHITFLKGKVKRILKNPEDTIYLGILYSDPELEIIKWVVEEDAGRSCDSMTSPNT